jgi:hypothetical protein
LDAQNAGNGISGLQISKRFRGIMPPDPLPPIHAWYVGHTHGLSPLLYPLIYYLTERSLFKNAPPTGKSLKKALHHGLKMVYVLVIQDMRRACYLLEILVKQPVEHINV